MTKKYILTADDVVDNLTSTDSTVPLSANQGRALNGKPDTLTGTTDPTSVQGKDGDLYIKYVTDGTTTKAVSMWVKISGEWVESAIGPDKKEAGEAIYVYNYSELISWLKKTGGYPIPIKLGADLKYSSGLGPADIKSGANIILDLNGHNITGVDGGYLGVRPFALNHGNFVLTGNGVISGFKSECTSASTEAQDGLGGCIENSGTFTMFGGTISGCSVTGISFTGAGGKGGAIYSSGSFMMYGGSITGCSAEFSGGGVYSNGDFYMYGGSITGCSVTDKNGGGAYLEKSIYLSKNATITGNTKGSSANNLYLGGSDSKSVNLYAEAFTGSVKVTYPTPAAGSTFGYLTSGITGAQNITNDAGTLKGSASGTSLKWVSV